MRRKPHLVQQVEQELDEHTAPDRPGDRKYVARGEGDDAGVLRDEQRDEVAHGPAASGAPHMSTGQWQGMVLGGVLGALIGAVLLLPLALVPFLEPVGARVALVCLTGALAGAVAGGVYWGGRAPELEGETLDVDGRPSSGTTLRNPETDERGR
jgi:hypothetical protein